MAAKVSWDDGVRGDACAGKTEWDYIACRNAQGAVLEFDVDGESQTMSTADYLAAVAASSAGRVRQQDKAAAARARKTEETKKVLLWMAAGGVGLLILRGL